MIRHVAGIAEIVEDVGEALRFYRDVLHLEVKEEHGEDYAIVIVPGVLHFGVWNRGHAAESTFGSRDEADRIPLGFTLEFEVDNVDDVARQVAAAGHELAHQPRDEPWGQKSCRMILPGGCPLGFAETSWARTITKQLEAAKEEA